MKYTHLVSVEELQQLLASGSPVMLFDCSFELMKPHAGDEQYRERHIPGAVRANLDRHLSAQHGHARSSGGRHPLPARRDFAAWLGSLGFSSDMQAVVYDRQGVNYCGRLWWMLKWIGHDAVAVLDGGLQAWEAAGAALSNTAPPPLAPTSFSPSPSLACLAGSDDVLAGLSDGAQTVLDARAAPRYRGEVEPLDPVAGHIPGALNRPFASNLQADGRFKDAQTLKAEFAALLGGRSPATVVHHCGSGVSAVPNVLAMELAGLGRTTLYAGSWSEWCSDSARPVAKG
jgi:thiosulfate/3-mercaptopyruvate sulfurtransferase